MRKKVSYSTFSKILTVFVVVLFIGIMWMEFHQGISHDGWIWVGIVGVLLICSCLYAPLGVEADEDYVVVRRLLRKKVIPIADIVSVSYAPPTMGEKRLCASGGFMGYWGWFSERGTGNYFGYYGRSSETFLIILRNGRRYMIGCDDSHEMADFINAQLSERKDYSEHRKGSRVDVGLLLFFLLSIAGIAHAKDYRPLPAEFDGSMLPYDLSENQSLREAVPDTLTPIFVNYIGRHGARFLSSDKKVDKLWKDLTEAHEKGYITPEGREFMELLEEVKGCTAGRWGALDSIGKSEQRELARQMHSLFPALMQEGKIEAEATYVPRVVMSMYEFCHELNDISSDLEIYTSEGKQNNRELRYFSVDKPYVAYLEDGAWKGPYERFVKEFVPVQPAVRLVSDRFGMDTDKMRKFSMDIYGVLQSLRAAGLPAPTTRWMSVNEYRACWEAANLDHFLRRTPNSVSPIPGEAAAPLLMSFIEYGDSAAAGKTGALHAKLRFGHAETLMPLFGLMHLQDCWSPSTDYNTIYKEWKDYEVVPLGANLIVVSLRGRSGRAYAAMRLNGRWVAPLGDGRLFVGWDELRAYWLSQLSIL